MKASEKNEKDTKQVFLREGTCSRTLFYVMNQEFEHHLDAEERASDVLAGGILGQGHQCGMLWGAALAVGAEAFRRCENTDQAIGLAVKAMQKLVASFSGRAKTLNCREITKADFNSNWSTMKYLFSGRVISCFKLADHWAPEAIQTALESLSGDSPDLPPVCVSCASEVARKMGASDEETVLVAAFAGGLGLSGHACGALGAAIWLKALRWCRENPGKSGYGYPGAKEVLDAFLAETKGEILCPTLSGRTFQTVDEHTEFINNGGCEKHMEFLVGLNG